MSIPTYFFCEISASNINSTIAQEFNSRREFCIDTVPKDQTKCIWEKIKIHVENAQIKKAPMMLICADSHKFRNNYSNKLLGNCIFEAKKNKADILLGCVDWFESGLQVSKNVFWINQFSGLRFVIIFKKFYPRILSSNTLKGDSADFKISSLTNKKFVIYPFVSSQKVNDSFHKVTVEDTERIEGKFELIKKVRSHFIANKAIRTINTIDTTDIRLPVYVINLKQRVDRRAHIIKEFANKDEFDVNIIEACKHNVGSVGLWKSIQKIIKIAMVNEEDLVIICEDDHTFTKNYDRFSFIQNILDAHEHGCDILCSGICRFNVAVPVTRNCFWIDSFWGTQFIVIFRRLFEKILLEPFSLTDAADDKLSEITSRKMVIFPFISVQKEFGYSDATDSNNNIKGLVTRIFKETSQKLKFYHTVYEKISKKDR